MTLVAFLRAVNVGGRVVKMDRPRALFEGEGFTNVETFIASGNVVFDARTKPSASFERSIEAVLHDNAVFEKTLGQPATMRGIGTMRKMADRYGS